eukprot:456289_1
MKKLSDNLNVNKFSKRIIKDTLDLSNKNVALELKWSWTEIAITVEAKIQYYAVNCPDLNLQTHLYATSVTILPSYNNSVKKDLVLEHLDRVNDGFKKLQSIDIYVKHLVNGYLREQQQILFSRTYFDIYSIAVVLLLYVPGFVKQGYMQIEGKKIKLWTKRWFVLQSNGVMSYYPNENKDYPIGRFNVLEATKLVYKSGNKSNVSTYGIKLYSPHRNWTFWCINSDQRSSWMKGFELVSGKKADLSEFVCHKRSRISNHL